MQSFKEFLSESLTEAKFTWPKEVNLLKATPAMIKKGESYTIIDLKNKVILKDRLQHLSAKEAVEAIDNEDIIYGSSSFIFDKYVSKW